MMSPRRTSVRSYSGQLPTLYFVLYFGWTRDLMLKIVFVPASERQEHRHCVPEEQHSRTNAQISTVVDVISQYRSATQSLA